MIRKLFTTLCLFALPLAIHASDTLVSLSGSTLTGFSGIKQDGGDSNPFRGQFESAANIAFHLDHGDEIKINVDLALASLINESGFGLSMLTYDLRYMPSDYQDVAFDFGYTVIPFGQFSENQTDNSKINSNFIYNDLAYVLLKQNQDVHQFKSNGAKVAYTSDYGSVESMIFNGTDGFDSNPDKGFGVALRYLNDSIIEDTTFSVSFLNSNDSDNPNAIQGNTTGYIADVKTNIYDIEFGGYASLLTLNDNDESTDDDVNVYMVYAAKNFGQYSLAARYSVINPEDYNGDGTGISSSLMPLGLSNLTVTDIDVSRFQLSGILYVSQSFNLHNELVVDSYADDYSDYNNIAFLSYASLAF